VKRVAVIAFICLAACGKGDARPPAPAIRSGEYCAELKRKEGPWRLIIDESGWFVIRTISVGVRGPTSHTIFGVLQVVDGSVEARPVYEVIGDVYQARANGEALLEWKVEKGVEVLVWTDRKGRPTHIRASEVRFTLCN
jgi:hypothetical protein